MGANGLDEYWVPEHVKDYLRKLGFVLPLDDMEPWIRSWDDWMSARGEGAGEEGCLRLGLLGRRHDQLRLLVPLDAEHGGGRRLRGALGRHQRELGVHELPLAGDDLGDLVRRLGHHQRDLPLQRVPAPGGPDGLRAD